MLEFFKVDKIDCFWRCTESSKTKVEARQRWVGVDGLGTRGWGSGPLLGSAGCGTAAGLV